uniref:Ku_N domain-containing protein n=1 Tax=Gongylonema pulchrum TaxID=637853 RepID=A0A183E6A2_9BILA
LLSCFICRLRGEDERECCKSRWGGGGGRSERWKNGECKGMQSLHRPGHRIAMTLYFALSATYSMLMPIAENNVHTRWTTACRLVGLAVEKALASDRTRKIKLIDFSRLPRFLSHDIRSAEHVTRALRSVELCSSVDLISLFSLMKFDRDCDRNSLLVIFTDACDYDRGNLNLTHLPNCALRFVCVLQENLVDDAQIARLLAITLATEGFIGDCDPKEVEPFLPYFISDYDSLETCSKYLAKDLFDTPVYKLKCGSLMAYFKVWLLKYVLEKYVNIKSWTRTYTHIYICICIYIYLYMSSFTTRCLRCYRSCMFHALILVLNTAAYVVTNTNVRFLRVFFQQVFQKMF